MTKSFRCVKILLEGREYMKKGFTLVELLAVIVILALIALITIPMVLGTVNKSEDSADKRSAENYRRAVKNAIAKENLNGNRVFPNQCTVIESGENQGNLNCTMPSGNSQVIKIKIEGNAPKRGTIVFEDGEPTQTTLYYKDVYVVIDAKGNSEIYKITSNNNTN